MKTEFKAKFLSHLNQKRQDKGFTLIELLVVIIIIGILSAIALPSFLNQANKAKQSEAKQYLASINKGLQAYYAENSVFSNALSDLGLGLKTATNNYTYTINAPTGDGIVSTSAPPSTSALKGYGAGVALVASGDAKTTQSILCENDTTGVAGIAPTVAATGASCGGGSKEVTK